MMGPVGVAGAGFAIVLCTAFRTGNGAFSERDRVTMADAAREMWHHGFDSYMRYAFPHDELKPLTKSYSNSLGELGNLKLEGLSDSYDGCALTLVDALPALAVLGNWTAFATGVRWLAVNLSFDHDVRVNVFEANIRLLGGLLSAHLLADGPRGTAALGRGGYTGQLLAQAHDLGSRLLRAFEGSASGLPYAWVNLRHGVRAGEVTETNTAAAGSLVIEFGVLSRLTGDPSFEAAALRALRALWGMRSRRGLWGTSLDMQRGVWLERNGGVGPGADSFYEYLLKAYILFGDQQYWCMFEQAYVSALQHYRIEGWFTDADIHTGEPLHLQFMALQAFFPGLQVLAGDVALAEATFWAFFSLWRKYGALPERWLLQSGQLHPTERYYPLRPELVESAFYLFQATGDARYREAGRVIFDGLTRHARVDGGFAALRRVDTMQQEDHMPSFFVAETATYLYLLYDPSFLQGGNYVFTTEGHPLPVSDSLRRAALLPGWPSLGCCCEGPGAECLLPPAEDGDVERNGSCDAPRGANASEAAAAAARAAAPNVWTGFPRYSHRKRRHRRGRHAKGRPKTALSLQQCLLARDSSGVARPRRSLCHVPDYFEDYTCHVDADCGVDHATCRRRACSNHGLCERVPR